MRCHEKNGCQCRLALLLTEVRQSPEMATVVLPDLLALPKDFGKLYYVANRSYWASECFFESHVCERQRTSGGWHNVEFLAYGRRLTSNIIVVSPFGGCIMNHQPSYSSPCPSCWRNTVMSCYRVPLR